MLIGLSSFGKTYTPEKARLMVWSTLFGTMLLILCFAGENEFFEHIFTQITAVFDAILGAIFGESYTAGGLYADVSSAVSVSVGPHADKLGAWLGLELRNYLDFGAAVLPLITVVMGVAISYCSYVPASLWAVTRPESKAAAGSLNSMVDLPGYVGATVLQKVSG